MKQFGLFSRKVENKASAAAESVRWRAYEDQPLSLTAPQRGETAIGQRALVMAFGAAAIAGAAYFATTMLMHDGGEQLLVSTDAVAAPVEQPEQLAQAAASPPASTLPKAADEAPPADAAPTMVPAPVKVATIAIAGKPRPKPAAPPAAEPKMARLSAKPAAPSSEQPATATPIAAASAFVAGADPLVSEGVQAVIKEATQGESKLIPAAASEDSSVDGRNGRIRTSVNMRSRPADGAQVIAVIPANTTVTVAPGCRHWCRVSFKGQAGYIYKSFLR